MNKVQNIKSIVSQGNPCLIMIDSRIDIGLKLPKHLMGLVQVKLRLLPKMDLQFKNNALNVTLSFGKVPFDCVIPLACIYYIADEDNAIEGTPYLSDMPEIFIELASDMSSLQEPTKANEIEFKVPLSDEEMDRFIDENFEIRPKRKIKFKSKKENIIQFPSKD